jgi:hypothetical protein
MTADGWCPLADLFGPDTPEELEWHWRREVRLWLARHGRSSVDVLAGLVDYRRGKVPAVRMTSTTPTPVDDSLGFTFGRLEHRNGLLREPEIADLLKATMPIVRAFQTELQPSTAGSPAPAHALLDVLARPSPRATDFTTAARAAAGLPPDRQDVYVGLLLRHLRAAAPPTAPAVLEILLRVLGRNVNTAYLRCVADVGLSPADRTQLLSSVECDIEVFDQVLDDAETDPRLVPVAVELWRAGRFDRHESSGARLAALLGELPGRLLRTIPAESLRRLGAVVPDEVLARFEAATDAGQ